MLPGELKRRQFEDACRPLMKFLAENCHPHMQVILSATEAELVEGTLSFVTKEYLID